MTGPILVGCDGSPQSLDALALAKALGTALGLEIGIAAVLPENPVGELDRAPFEAALEAHFDEILDPGAEQLGELPVEQYRLRGTSPAAQLAGLAEQLGAQLLIVGSTHRGPLGRVYPGSVGESLLHAAPCPVAIAPRGYEGPTPPAAELVGVGFDGHSEALAALEFAEPLASALGARLHLLAGVPYRLPIKAELDSPLDARGVERDRLQQALTNAAEDLPASTAVELAEIEPHELLVERSEQLDLLVLGSRGYGPVKQVLLGAVSGRVVRGAECPVVVVPRASN